MATGCSSHGATGATSATFGAAVRDLKSVLGGRRVTTAVPVGEELVFTDAALLEQVLVNLLDNAAKYSPTGAPVDLAARRHEDVYELTVCDQGTGIPPAERERVFDIFHRARAADQQAPGTGMGLAICKGFVEALGGTIDVTDTGSHGGSCIRVCLSQPSLVPGPPGDQE